jgi:hypothetical protein
MVVVHRFDPPRFSLSIEWRNWTVDGISIVPHVVFVCDDETSCSMTRTIAKHLCWLYCYVDDDDELDQMDRRWISCSPSSAVDGTKCVPDNDCKMTVFRQSLERGRSYLLQIPLSHGSSDLIV